MAVAAASVPMDGVERPSRDEEEGMEYLIKETIPSAENGGESYAIKGVDFGIMSGEEIAKYGEVEVLNQGYFDPMTHKQLALGCHDPHLGAMNRMSDCQTCGKNFRECPGHFGSIKLVLPVFHVGYFRHVQLLLSAICKRCGRVLLPPEKRSVWLNRTRKATRDVQQQKAVFRKLVDTCKKVRQCPFCDAYNGAVKKGTRGYMTLVHELPKDQAKVEYQQQYSDAVTNNPEIGNHLSKVAYEDLTPLHLLPLLAKMPPSDQELLKLPAQPERLVVTHVPVSPVCIRPSVQIGDAGTQEDDLSVQTSDIVATNNNIRATLSRGGTLKQVAEQWQWLSAQVALMMNSEATGLAAAAPTTKPIRSICSRLKGKEGRFRGNLSGKRVNFSGRTVISPDPNLEVTEVIIPQYSAMKLTFPEVVCRTNIDMLRDRVIRGTEGHPGAHIIRLKSGGVKNLAFIKKQIREELAADLQYGDVVERHLQDGDVVLFNRQPSLHKMSIMAHRAKVMPWRTFRFNECVCSPYNADFDGDEMNIHLPQTQEARAEALALMGVQNNLITSKNGEPIVAATQDFLTSAWLLTQRDTFLTKDKIANIAMYFGKAAETIELPPPTIMKPVQLWTGKQLISLMLRPSPKSNVLTGGFNRPDPVVGVSESIIMGNPVHLGTGLFKLMYDVPQEEMNEEVKIGAAAGGRIEFELFADTCPETAENFRGLCTGEYGPKLTYTNSKIFKSVKGEGLQGGDIINNDGTSGMSVYGKPFRDENSINKHSGAGILTTTYQDETRHNNTSQFMVTYARSRALDFRHVPFGRVSKGMEVIRAIEKVPTDDHDRPRVDIVVVKCGMVGKKEVDEALQERRSQREEGRFKSRKQLRAEGVATAASMGKKLLDSAAAAAEGGGGEEEDIPIDLEEEGEGAASSSSESEVEEVPPMPPVRPAAGFKNKREARMFELRLKMNQARVANEEEVLREEKDAKQGGNRKQDEGGEGSGVKRQRYKKGEDWDHTRWYLNEQASMAEARDEKKARKGKNHTFGWEVFNEDSLYRAHDKKLADVQFNEVKYDKQKEAMGQAFYDDENVISAKPSEEGKERLAKAMKKAEEKKSSFSRRRLVNPDEDVDYINARNQHFNKKIEREFGKYTKEIKANLERGTAL
ncbi:pre-mRNA-splicing factor syf2 [Perkinsus chesapeaki]|uniref:DNA-directed RNA polymerase subunit n=1 Tax=Perkinsus chesapeaki TaxID=330153 RepID=A0A7J6MZ99_PERCH|nr:pre-mRNA-splicing factor syf2 [Perkinsus chesapeaki]